MTDPTISTGELRRRHDLLTNLQQDSHHLTTLLNSTPSNPVVTAAFSANGSQSSSANPSPRTTRRFGTAKAQETAQTRPLDNSGLVQLQRTQMEDQDRNLEILSTVVRRQKQIGLAIGNELEAQNQLLDELDVSIDRTKRNMKSTTKKLDRVTKG